MKKVAFHTLGCKLNFSETSTIARSFIDEGFQRVDFHCPADVYVVNTCSVTENADKRFKGIVRKAQQINPEAFVVAIGCYAQLKPDEIAAIDGVDLVLGAHEKFKVTQYLNDLVKSEPAVVHSCEIHEANIFEPSYAIGDRTRAFLKVQDGCDYKCTYCTIPLARGKSRSARLEDVLKQAKTIAETGVKEIVLTGVNIGDYGKGEFGNLKHDHTFMDLVRELDKVEGISRLRISSIEPNLLKDEIIDFVAASKNFVPHFHIPLQSGSDAVLKKMRRRYLSQLYVQRVNRIREVMPHACIGVDVIVGFPGESDNDFLTTYNFLNELDISYLHVFTYSERDNTPAAEMDGVVPMAIRSRRSKMLRALSVKKRRAFYEQHLGKEFTVLFESENREGYIQGFTENYIKVKMPWDPALANTLVPVVLDKIGDDGLVRIKADLVSA